MPEEKYQPTYSELTPLAGYLRSAQVIEVETKEAATDWASRHEGELYETILKAKEIENAGESSS